MSRRFVIQVLLVLAAGPATCAGQANSPTPEALAFFETKIRPILAEHCYACHSDRATKLRGGLRLDQSAFVVDGGESGPVVIPGKPSASTLIQAVRYESLQMPPRQRLAQRDIDLLVHWVRIGAPFPPTLDEPLGDHDDVDASAGSPTRSQITAEDRAYWAYQPLRQPSVPTVGDASRFANPIDAFVMHRLDQVGLAPNDSATPRELVRRLAFDLTGLPPDISTVARFTANPTEAHWGMLVEEYLSRPTYGERWARHWLDIVRYAQTNGYERDAEKPYAWRYRDYVIQSFNDDKPFDQFVVEQLAGDQLQAADHAAVIATAFYRLGVWDDEPDDATAAEFDGLDDNLSTIGQVFLGQTIGCARCHDHMFDPISQRDYYQLLAFIRNIRPYEIPRTQLDSAVLVPLADDEFLKSWQRQQATKLAALEQQREQLAPDDATGRAAIEAQVIALKKAAPSVDWTLAVREACDDPLPTHVLIRGDPRTPGPRVTAGIPEIFGDTSSYPSAPTSKSPPSPTGASGPRLELARWVASSKNPLTARVIANRVWQHHFGRGIVRTPNDMGRAGSQPTHPKLLDWLASELVSSGWSIKHLHRLILQSSTWRMASRAANRRATELDPGNELFWRQNVRRLDAEAIRDSALQVADTLNLEHGGRGFFPLLDGEVVAGQSKPGFGWEISSIDQRRRRSIYSFLKRGLRDPLMEAFDHVNINSPLGVRPTTTVAPQALVLLNGTFMQTQARFPAKQIAAESGSESQAQVAALYRRLFARTPTRVESEIAQQYLMDQAAQFERLANVITFRPNVPTSLYSEYRKQLASDQYLIGPKSAWSYYAGKWSAGYEAIESVDARQGPFALCTDAHFAGGTVHGRLRIDAATEVATLLVRAQSVGTSWNGVAFTLDPRAGQLVATVRDQATVNRIAIPWKSAAGRWLPFRIESADSTLRFYLGTNAPLEVDVSPDMIGYFGVATWGGPIEFDTLRIEPAVTKSKMPHGWIRMGGDWKNAEDGTWSVRQTDNATTDNATTDNATTDNATTDNATTDSEESDSEESDSEESDSAKSDSAKVVRTHQQVENCVVDVDLRMAPGKSSMGGVLLRVNNGEATGSHSWQGYEIRLDAIHQQIVVGDHRNGTWQVRATQPGRIEPGKWHHLRIALNGSFIFVNLDSDATQVSFQDPNPLPAGWIGLQTWNSEMAFRNLEIREGDRVSKADFRPLKVVAPRYPTDPRQRALEALCQVLMNLNEFIYVD